MPYHAAAAGTELHVFAYVTSADPGAIGAGKGWVDTSSGPPYQLKIRNTANTGWDSVGVSGVFALDADLTAHEADTTNPHSVTASQAGAEPALGNPATNGYVLKSTTAGVRSWAPVALDAIALDDLTDVDTSTVAPTNGQALVWDNAAAKWEPGTVAGGSGHTIEDEGTPLTARTKLNFIGAGVAVTDDSGDDATVVTIAGGAADLDDLTDVDLTVAPTDGQALLYNNASSTWKAGTVAGGSGSVESDLYANRPAAGAEGALFFPTDGATIERDNGTVWQPWGPIFPLTRPVLADFAWINQNSATAVEQYGGIYMKGTTAVNRLRILKKSAPATPYTVTAAFEIDLTYTNVGTNFQSVGLVFRESATGKVQTFGITPNANISSIPALWIGRYSAPDTYVNGPLLQHVSQLQTGRSGLWWLRIEADGTNVKFYVSPNGIYWRLVFSEVKTGAFTTAPDEVGFYVSNNASAFDPAMFLLHWKQA